MEGVEAEGMGREEGTAGVSGGLLEEAAMVQGALLMYSWIQFFRPPTPFHKWLGWGREVRHAGTDSGNTVR